MLPLKLGRWTKLGAVRALDRQFMWELTEASDVRAFWYCIIRPGHLAERGHGARRTHRCRNDAAHRSCALGQLIDADNDHGNIDRTAA